MTAIGPVDLVLVGLAAGYLTYALTVSAARPNWWVKFVAWWTAIAPAGWRGRPFGCAVCMSLWMSFLFLLPQLVWEFAVPSYAELACGVKCVSAIWFFFAVWPMVHLVYVMAAAAIGLAFVMAMGALRR